MVYVTAVKMSPGGTKHEHIAEVKWSNPSTGKSGKSSRSEMVRWIDEGGDARVRDALGEVKVHTVHPAGRSPYIQTYRDGRPTDNLLHLPRYQ